MFNSIHYTAFKTILIRECLRFIRIWKQTVVPPIITTVLYFLIFGKLIGERIGEMGGHSYMLFIIPGVVLMAVISHSYANVVSSFFMSKYQKNIEEILIAPVPNHIILAGYIGGGIARGMVVGAVVFIVALFFSPMQIYSYPFMLLIVVLTSLLFSLAGFINAVYAKTFADISVIPTFVITPFTYLGGVFYSIDLLPPFWQTVSLFNPVLYMVNGFRYGMLGVTDTSPLMSVVIILVFSCILAFFSLHLLKKGVGIKQ
jgi:ABC-2 type transport system permease protein